MQNHQHRRPRFDVTCLGEIMLRLSVPTGERLSNASSLDVEIGGAEGNVSIALARLGRRVSWLGRLPEHALGERVVRALRSDGVDVSGVRRAANARVGLYFIEYASLPRSIEVVYDRADSAAAQMQLSDVAWDVLLDGKILHMTGITPALGPTCHEITCESIRRAHAAGLTISFDVNFRSKLWDHQAASKALRPLLEQADILFCKSADASLLFGCTGAPEQQLRSLAAMSCAKTIFLTCGESGASVLHEGVVESRPALPSVVIDRIGSGDAFAAGALDGMLDGDPIDGLQRGITLAAIALSQRGDRVLTSRQELDAVMRRASTDISR